MITFFLVFQDLKTRARSPFVRRDIRSFSHFVPLCVCTAFTNSRPSRATINKLASGKWRVQVRCKGHYLSTSFLLRKDADMWARRVEREIGLGQKPARKHNDGIKTVSDLIDLHIAEMAEVGKAIDRSKRFSLDLLRARLGNTNLADLSRGLIIEFGKQRAEDGAGPVTVGIDIDIGYIHTLLVHGAAAQGLPLSAEPVQLGRVALVCLGLVGRGNERGRRPTDGEIEAIIRGFDDQQLPSHPSRWDDPLCDRHCNAFSRDLQCHLGGR